VRVASVFSRMGYLRGGDRGQVRLVRPCTNCRSRDASARRASVLWGVCWRDGATEARKLWEGAGKFEMLAVGGTRRGHVQVHVGELRSEVIYR